MRGLPICLLALSLPLLAPAQTVPQRVDDLRRRQALTRDEGRLIERDRQREMAARMQAPLARMQLVAPLREALHRWSAAAKVPLVVTWASLELEGVDPAARVEVDLAGVPAVQVLSLLLRQGAPEIEFVWDVEPGYVRLMSREQANRMPVISVYEVMDLLMETPNFTDAPRFDLGSALQGGGTSGRRNGNLFGEGRRDDEPRLTRRERGVRLAQLVRDTIEPGLWDENGGVYGHSVRYWNGRLIVRAPKYVQRQIGTPIILRSPGSGGR